jgi:hypothetical protein
MSSPRINPNSPPYSRVSPKSPTDLPPPPIQKGPRSPTDLPPPKSPDSPPPFKPTLVAPLKPGSVAHKKALEDAKEYEKVGRKQPNERMEHLVGVFWENKPFVKDIRKYDELEIKFGTKGIKPITKIDYDNVIKQFKSYDFSTENPSGSYMLRIQTEYLDAKSGEFRLSPIRVEIEGIHAIQEYCKHNSIKKLMEKGHKVLFTNKVLYGPENGDKLRPVNFDDFNFRVSYNVENSINSKSPIINNIIDNWEKSKKMFRYINRVTLQNEWVPFKVDMSIVKSSKFSKSGPALEYTTSEANVFNNPETFEIELEVDNGMIGPGRSVDKPQILVDYIKKLTKYVLMGLQETNYPISYPEQMDILREYMHLLQGDKKKKEGERERLPTPRDFAGPSSNILQHQNIAPLDENNNGPNIRANYTVTEKADGSRALMLISSKGKIYLINTNMHVKFTGATTDNKEIFNTLIDGEIVLHDKYGTFINLYAAFDIYFVNKDDVSSKAFVPKKKDELKANYRLPILKHVIKLIKAKSVVKGANSPIRIESKEFYPINPYDESASIFDACHHLLSKESEGLFEYNTDGLIFTPTDLAVGGNEPKKNSKLGNTRWDYSLKWKPAHYNTIDFLVTTKRGKDGQELVTPIFHDGTNASSTSQIDEYKTIILRCGFNEGTHGYINPCQDVIDDKLPSFSTHGQDSRAYYPVQFFPTNPYDPEAGICHIMLKKDDTGVKQMFTEENEVFDDNTIVEFRYDLDREAGWRWIPMRVRNDKTTELRNGGTNFGNAYHVANSNWHSIHSPITEEMLSTGQGIPDVLDDEEVYYKKSSGVNTTQGLRDFHNLYVKKMLITSVAKRGDTMIDYACGKGGDFSKWIQAKLSFVFGIDVAKDNLENRLDGACARYLNYCKKFKHVPGALFVNGNSGSHIRTGYAMLNDKAATITKAVFGNGPKEGLGKGVEKHYGKGEDGFDISSVQFALHYFFENQKVFQNFMRNVSECTKLGGYFIGTCYDGDIIFNLLKKKAYGESVELYNGDKKIWQVVKEYDEDKFEDDVSSLGYQINVYQESINKMFAEYLVNFNYLERVMENYGFKLITRDEAKTLGLPEGSGLFVELYNQMNDELKRNPFKRNDYGLAQEMTANDQKISFYNRYFVFKKIRNVNAEKVALESIDETQLEKIREKKRKGETLGYKKKESKPKEHTLEKKKGKARSLNRRILLVDSSEQEKAEKAEKEEREEKDEPLTQVTIIKETIPEPEQKLEEPEQKLEEPKKKEKKEKKEKPEKPKKKKQVFIIEGDDDEA